MGFILGGGDYIDSRVPGLGLRGLGKNRFRLRSMGSQRYYGIPRVWGLGDMLLGTSP